MPSSSVDRIPTKGGRLWSLEQEVRVPALAVAGRADVGGLALHASSSRGPRVQGGVHAQGLEEAVDLHRVGGHDGLSPEQVGLATSRGDGEWWGWFVLQKVLLLLVGRGDGLVQVLLLLLRLLVKALLLREGPIQ